MSDSKIADSDFCVLVLAGGLGTRMKSELPKVLHKVCGRPIIGHIIKAADSLSPAAIGVIIGHQADRVREEVSSQLQSWQVKTPVEIFLQKELTGSGRAVQESIHFFSRFKKVLVLCGDTPLITECTLSGMTEFFKTNKADAVVLTADVPDPRGYGRIVKNSKGEINRIVEQSDADETISKISEINSGMYLFNTEPLLSVINNLVSKPPKNEFYLTDVIELLKGRNAKILPYKLADYKDALGINSRIQLAEAESIMRRRTSEKLMLSGVTLVNPDAVYIDAEAVIENDVVIYPNVHIVGKSVIKSGSVIQPNCYINASAIGANCEIKFASYINESVVLSDCSVGPYAHIRPKCEIGPNAKVGNFSEVKASKIGKGSKVPHLSYIGDAVLGENINIGAGTITCNYDGVKKHKTVIEDGVFVGSNVNLVAPVTISSRSKIGAGSTITDDVPAQSLALARARQIVKPQK